MVHELHHSEQIPLPTTMIDHLKASSLISTSSSASKGDATQFNLLIISIALEHLKSEVIKFLAKPHFISKCVKLPYSFYKA